MVLKFKTTNSHHACFDTPSTHPNEIPEPIYRITILFFILKNSTPIPQRFYTRKQKTNIFYEFYELYIAAKVLFEKKKLVDLL